MSKPVTPQFSIDLVQLQTLKIRFHPEWDGANWVLSPATIELEGIGDAGALENLNSPASILLTADTLPNAGQTALTELYNFIEQLLADEYN